MQRKVTKIFSVKEDGKRTSLEWYGIWRQRSTKWMSKIERNEWFSFTPKIEESSKPTMVNIIVMSSD